MGEVEDAAVGLPDQAGIAPLAPDVARLRDGDPLLAGLVGGAPKRRADRHRGQLAVAALVRPRLARHLVLLGQPRVERTAQGHVAGAAAGGHQDALFARMFTVRPSWVAVMPSTRPEDGLSRTMLCILW